MRRHPVTPTFESLSCAVLGRVGTQSRHDPRDGRDGLGQELDDARSSITSSDQHRQFSRSKTIEFLHRDITVS